MFGRAAVAGALVVGAAAPVAEAGVEPVDVQLLSITDFHGYLQPGNDQLQMPDGSKVAVGGAAYNAAHLKRLREGRRNSILSAAGDSFSGWPFEVDAFWDEPTIEVLNKLGVRFSTTGNHELDVSAGFLKDHMMRGRCFGKVDVDSCFTDSTGRRFRGAKFPFYSANIVDARGRLILKPYNVEWVRGPRGRIPVGFINLTVPDTPVGSTSYQPGLRSLPMVETANRYAKELRRRGVRAIVANVHDGGSADGAGFNGCKNPWGPVIDFAKAASPEIDAIFTGHWHAGFNCQIADPAGKVRPVIEGLNHGKLISEIGLKLDPRTGEVLRDRTTSVNHPVTRDIAPDPEMKRIVDYWKARGDRRAGEVVAEQTGDFTRALNAHGESTMGDLAADVQYWEAARNGKVDLSLLAIKPVKGSVAVARDLPQGDGRLTYGEAWPAYGYGNPILTVTVTGEQIHQALEQQWQGGKFAPFAVSKNVRYRYDASRPEGDRVDPEDVLIGGKPLDTGRRYRLAALAYTLIGADGYPALGGFTDARRNALPDHEAFIAYVKAQKKIAPAPLERVNG
ncbi:bifunctional UDP-sugar hydrolase/5'-nucleotidase [Actinomadura fulvescens]